MELGFRISIISGFPDSLGCIPDSKAQDSRIQQQKFPGFLNPDYRKSSIKSRGGLFISSPFEGELNRDGGLFNLETTMVSVLHKELEYKVEKLKYKKVGGHAAEDQNQIRTSSW